MTAWERTKNAAFRLAASLTVLAIGAPGLVIVFSSGSPTRWLVACLTALLFLISLVTHVFQWGHNRPLMRGYLLAGAALISALLWLNPGLNFYIILFYVLSTEALMCFDRREGYRWLGFFTLLATALLFALTNFVEAAISIPIFLGGFFFFATFANATYQANRARAESQRLLEELQAAHRQLQEYAAQAGQLAIAEERNRLAREVHDTIGHRLTVAAVQLEGAGRLIARDPAKAEEMVATVREQVREALHELRQTVATLREPLEADLPLDDALQRLAAGFEGATGLTINLLIPEAFPDLSAAHRLALYRAAQEALTNVQKHAQAGQVWLQVAQQEGSLTLRVSDNGVGFPDEHAEAGFGLRGIRERAAQLGGGLHIGNRAGGGAQISLSLPVTPIT
jgi:signal transduction histidine kinase